MYKATIIRKDNNDEKYTGVTELNKKNRWYYHNLNFNNRIYFNSTMLSKHVRQINKVTG